MPAKRTKKAAKRLPKKKCCVSRPKCKRCPLRMLAEGTLPDGFGVKKRRLTKLSKAERAAQKAGRGKLPRAA